MRRRGLIEGAYFQSLAISTVTIVFVQLASFGVTAGLMAEDKGKRAEATADAVAALVAEPMYNVDESQVVRLAESLVATGIADGVRIESTAAGATFRIGAADPDAPEAGWRTRPLHYAGYDLGSISILPSNRDLMDIFRLFASAFLAMLAAVVAANFAAANLLVKRRIDRVFGGIAAGIGRAGAEPGGLPRSGYADMDLIVDALNGMAAQVEQRRHELLEANEGLERRVAERTVALEAALAEQTALRDRLIAEGKLSALGRLSAGIAHEFNTPLGAVMAASSALVAYLEAELPGTLGLAGELGAADRALLAELVRRGIAANSVLELRNHERRAAAAAAEVLEARGVGRSRDIAAYLAEAGIAGQAAELAELLAASVRPEVARAAAGVAGARRMAEVIAESGRKAAGVVAALRSYLAAGAQAEAAPLELGEDIGRAVELMRNMLKVGVEVKADFAPARVLGRGGELAQVWINIIRNAAQAMGFKGLLELRTWTEAGRAYASFADSGPGMPPEVLARAFEPFFTTRPGGEGMGLGLDICRRIVENHGGAISVESQPGRTIFIVDLPVTEG